MPAARLSSLAVVLPCRNEAGSLPATLREVLDRASPIADRLEVVVVDDASTDGTGAVAEAFGEEGVRVVRREVSHGYGAALRSGFDATTADVVFYTDGDGQIDLAPLAELPRLLAGADMVIGYRVNRSEGVVRRFNAWAWTGLVNLAFGLRVRDVDCAFKVFPGDFLRRKPLVSTGALISAELMARARRAGLRVAAIAVSHRPRRAGRATGADPAVIARAFVELLTLARRIRRGG